MLSRKRYRILSFCLWLVAAAVAAQAQTSRGASAASYLERGSE